MGCKTIQFIGESKPLSPGSFTQKLLDSIETQKTYFEELSSLHKPKYVSQSLSSQDVVAYLGSKEFSESEFVQCVSIVFMMQNEVYKMPVTVSAELTLLDLLDLHTRKLRGCSPKQILLPHDRKKVLYTLDWMNPQISSSHLKIHHDQR